MWVRMYRLFNVSVGEYGVPFAMCDDCVRTYNPPVLARGECRMELVVDGTELECENKGHRETVAGGVN